jgi:predicted DNA-binding transcriptional regulator AlpA
MKLLSLDELRPKKGINYHPQHIKKLIKDGKFPRPIRLSGGKSIAFIEEEVDQYLEGLKAQRDSEVTEAA